MPSHWNSFRSGGYTGVAAGGIAEVSDALANGAQEFAQLTLNHAADLAWILNGVMAFVAG